MANELKDTSYCDNCKFYKYTGRMTGFCVKRMIATKDKAVCGAYKEQ